jgi:transglutaminase-like putative cysteine protease
MFMHHDFSAKQDYWLSKRIKVPYGLKWDLTRASGVATFLLVLAAWGGPVFARSATVSDLWTDVSGPWLSVRARLSDLVASLRSPIVYVGDTFGPTLQLSAGVKPNDSVVMVVDPSSQLRAGGRFYWQARTYSNYENGEWSDSSQLSQDYTPTPAGLAVPDWQARQAVDVTFYPRFPALSRLYLAAGTNWVNRSGEVWYSTMGGPERDVTAFISRPPVHDGEAYLTHASVAVPTASQLELAGKDYPSWVREAYLQVPNSLTDRFRTLARNITSQAETPYDQAEAVTAWLRNNIEYSRVTESPPEGREPLDWFVFDYKVGFCNFYASSEVMMLRTLGVPTRLSVGYAAGTPKEPSTLILGNPISKLDFSSSPYEVRGNDAHAWPEVFFPGYGWVPFEPTTSQPEIRRGTINAVTANGATLLGERDPLSASTGPNPDAGKPIENGRTAGAAHHIQGLVRQGILRIVLAVLLLAALLVAVALRIDPSWNLTGQLLAARSMARLGLRSSNQAELDTLAGGSPAARRYAAWTNWLPKLGVELKRSQTPFERLSLLVAQLPEAEFSSRRIVEGFAAERFGGQAPSPREEIERTWSELHRLFWETYLSRLGGRLLAIVQDPQRRDVGRRQHLDVTMGPR